LFTGIPGGDPIQGQLGQHPLVPVPPPQKRHGVGEDLLSSHGHQQLADALVLLSHCGRRCSTGIHISPGGFGTILALGQVLRGTCARSSWNFWDLGRIDVAGTKWNHWMIWAVSQIEDVEISGKIHEKDDG